MLSSKNTLEGPKCLSVSSTTSPVHGAQASEPAHAVGGGLPLDHLAIRSQAVSPPVPALRKKLGALPQAPPPNTPPLLEAHTEHQPVGLDEERGGVQVKLPGLARHKCVITSGVEGGQGQMGVVLSTLANLKQVSPLRITCTAVCMQDSTTPPPFSPTCRPCSQLNRRCNYIFS